jgi:hypothetical protein
MDKGSKGSSYGAITTPELGRLRLENEVLKLEVAKWKELLVLREIRNGGNPVIRTPSVNINITNPKYYYSFNL